MLPLVGAQSNELQGRSHLKAHDEVALLVHEVELALIDHRLAGASDPRLGFSAYFT